MASQPAFDLFSTFVHVKGNGAASSIEVNETFWQDLMTGARTDLNEGWLAAAFRMTGNSPTWEMHPAGDELLLLLSGKVDIVMQDGEDERIVELRAGRACIVPRGAWHRQVVHEPGELLGITFGKGTEHRPV